MKIIVRHIIRTGYVEKRPSKWYEYKKAIKFLGITFRPEGVYNMFSNICNIDEECFVLQDGIIYEKPYIWFDMVDDRRHRKHFNTDQEAINYHNNFLLTLKTLDYIIV